MSAVATTHPTLSRPSAAVVATVAVLAALLVLAAVVLTTLGSGTASSSVPAEVGDGFVPVCEQLPVSPC